MTTGSLRKDAVTIVGPADDGSSILSQTLVGDVMESNFCYFDEEQGMALAVGELLRQKLTGAPVLDENGRLKGFLSLKDCLPFAQVFASSVQVEPVKVGHLMSRETHALSPDISLEEALKAFVNQWFHVYPVADKAGKVVGILSRCRLLSFLCQ
ncbi:MAG: CBS domain-containing protein [Oligoflexus sp.]